MNLTVPITEDEQVRLEKSLMYEGCREPILVWQDIILDGHKRYRFCSYEEIEYDVREMEFASQEEAIIWICKRRIEGLNKRSDMYRYLIGNWYNAQKALNKEKRRQGDGIEQNPEYVKSKRNSVWDTCARMADEVGINRSTISHYGIFANAMGLMSDRDPKLFEAILRGDIQFQRKEIIEMAAQDDKKLSEIREKKLGGKDVKMRNRNRKESRMPGADNEEKRMDEEIPIITGIKNMPEYDPDMEVNGLMLTIPTWISVIERTEKKSDINLATVKAKLQLTANLNRLRDQIDRMLEVLKCTMTER